MNNAITGISMVRENELDDLLSTLSEASRSVRYVHDLEKLMVAAVEVLLKDARVGIPSGRDDIGMYLGIDDSVEDIKNEFFTNIIKDGLLGASPLLFPFTSPNALTAQASIVFDLRGESILMPLKGHDRQAMDYADECVSSGHAQMAITGNILKIKSGASTDDGEYEARLCFIEAPENAKRRGARIYNRLQEMSA